MPAGTDVLRGSRVEHDRHTSLTTSDRGGSDSVAVSRADVPDGAVNVLSLPYVLAAMDLRQGDRFTLPGFALIGGPDGNGTPWRGAFQVASVSTLNVKGRDLPVAEVLLDRMDAANGLTLDAVEPLTAGRRRTRLLISPEPPYLLGRMDMTVRADGDTVPVRESLGLVDWEPLPLPASDLTDESMWDLDLDAGRMMLRSASVPQLLVPLR